MGMCGYNPSTWCSLGMIQFSGYTPYVTNARHLGEVDGIFRQKLF